MKRFIDVHAGEIMAAAQDTVLRSNTNNACLVYVAYDKIKRIGALAHSMFLSGSLGEKWSSHILCDAERAIDEMIGDMKLLGSNVNDISIQLVSGENVPGVEHNSDYDANLRSAVDLIKKKHLNVNVSSAKDVGQAHVALDVATGEVYY